MKEKPILFSGAMVKAILEGRKTQTRRVVKGEALDWLRPDGFAPSFVASPGNFLSPYGFAGDRLWVRETWGMVCPEMMDAVQWEKLYEDRALRFHPESTQEDGIAAAIYRADGEFDFKDYAGRSFKWKPSIYMPRWASRITLEIMNVRIERLQDISRDDAKAESVSNVWKWTKERNAEHPEHFVRGVLNPYVANYSVLWDEINGKNAWDLNPWVWVIEFKKVV